MQNIDNASLEKAKKEAKASKIIINVLLYIFLIVGGTMVLLPFLWMIMNSFKTQSDYYAEEIPSFLPAVFTFENYTTIWENFELLTYIFNSLIFSVVTTFVMVLICVLAAFAFARLNFYGKNALFLLYLATMMVPMELFTITNYMTICNLELRDTFVGVIFPSVISVFYIYLLRQNFMQVPDQIYYAAKVDGTSDFKYLFKVLVPLSKPTIMSIIVLKFIECWNSYAWPNLITRDSERYFISQGIEKIKAAGLGTSNIPACMAVVTIVTIPLLIIFFVFRKQIMTGVSKSGLKG